MRDIKRIDKFCNKLKELWLMFPDFRFQQVLDILEVPEELQGTDPFFWEEDKWIGILENTINTYKKDK